MIEGPVRFQLRGADLEAGLDTQFTLVSKSQMIGNMKSFMRKDRKGWAIINRNGRVLAKTGTTFPLGLTPWAFPDPNEPENKEKSKEKDMLLHLYTEQPGQFCCEDGFCIDSRTGY